MQKLLLMGLVLALAACTAAGNSGVAPGGNPSNPSSNNTGAGKVSFDRNAIAPAFVQGTNDFGFKLLNVLGDVPNANVFISPASVALALALANNGAAGATQQAIGQTLGTAGMSLNDANSAYANLQGLLRGADPKLRLDIANSLWARKDVAFQPDFLQRAVQYFGATVTPLDFNDTASANTINAWVKQNTQDKIDKIIDPPIAPQTVLILINAIYFKGAWQRPFDAKLTVPMPFHLPDGTSKDVSMMRHSGNFGYLRGTNFQAVRLPYGDDALSMMVFLPNEGVRLADFQKTLSGAQWATWRSQLVAKDGDLALPKFKLEYEKSLNDALMALGMEIAFQPGQADFSGMMAPPPQLYISHVKHKTFVEVNEEGTEAAAVTAVEVRAVSAVQPEDRFSMVVDRPFFVAIQDNVTGLVLFSGLIANPS